MKICSTHLFKAIQNSLKNHKFSPSDKKLLTVTIAKLICCENFYLFIKIAKKLAKLLTTKQDSDDLKTDKSFLEKVSCKTLYEKLPKKVFAKGNEKEIYKNSPFYIYFEFAEENIQNTIESEEITNSLFSPEFFHYFYKKIITYAPMWSSFIEPRESNANVESYFRFIKRDILNYVLKQKPGRIINALHKYIDSLFFELQNDIPTKPMKKKDIPNIPRETWKSKICSPKIFTDGIVGILPFNMLFYF